MEITQADASRLLIIKSGLVIEDYVSIILCMKLGIDQSTSKTLGSKSTSLSFKQKIDLLIDMNLLDSKNVAKLITFSEIRNQFAHNNNINCFHDCFETLNGKEEYLKKLYHFESKITDREKILDFYLGGLVTDIRIILKEIVRKIQSGG